MHAYTVSVQYIDLHSLFSLVCPWIQLMYYYQGLVFLRVYGGQYELVLDPISA